MNIEERLANFTRDDYQRDNFDDFLNAINFSFNIPAIHIAGTNGKGSTAHYLKEIYSANGYKVGIYSSPDTFEESIKINDECIDVSFVEKIFKEYEKKFNKYELSGFEIQTFIAFKYFLEQKVDLAIIECGMGGEIDATNIFSPILSIITSISMEHTSFLGESLSEIAMHKAGIIKPDVPVLINEISEEPMQVIVNRTKDTHSKILQLDLYHNYQITDDGGASFDYRPYFDLHIQNPTKYSVIAACFAIEATKYLQDLFPVNEESVKRGLNKMHLKGRFEILHTLPLVIADGAHNPEGINNLRNEMDALYPNKNIKIVFASFTDKNITSMLPEIGLLGKVYLTTFNHPRARTEDDYFLYLEDYEFKQDYKELINSLIAAEDSEIILVTGSLAFVYEIRKWLKK